MPAANSSSRHMAKLPWPAEAADSSRWRLVLSKQLSGQHDDPSLGRNRPFPGPEAFSSPGTKPVLVSLVVVSTFQKPPQKRWLEGIFLGRVVAEWLCFKMRKPYKTPKFCWKKCYQQQHLSRKCRWLRWLFLSSSCCTASFGGALGLWPFQISQSPHQFNDAFFGSPTLRGLPGSVNRQICGSMLEVQVRPTFTGWTDHPCRQVEQ